MAKFTKSVQILLFLLFLAFITKNVYCDSDDECSSYFGSDDENDTDTESDTDESDVEPPANYGGYESDSSIDSLAGINVDNLPDIPIDIDDDDDDYDGTDDDDE
uniref:Candidate secreted effector n=1 Tax=Meloidogyne incognita TaxID=6306 RepID=A0A914LVA2_MELIC